MSEDELMEVRADLGMVFQEGALFDSLTVRENVGYKLFEELHWPIDKVDARVEEVLGFVGLGEFIDRMPSELSGGQRRRVAIARAMAAKPRILLYDEPTTGLDPITALTVDEEIIKLRDLEGVSSILVTHQLRDAFFVAEHAATRNGAEIAFDRAAEGEGGPGGVHHAEGRRDPLRGERRRAARDRREGRVHPVVFVVNGREVMPRTRSLAWSELKIGVMAVAALVLTALLDHRGRRRERLLLGALHHQDPLPRRPGAEVRGRSSASPASRWARSPRSSSPARRSRSACRSRKRTSRASPPSRCASIGSMSLLGEPLIDVSPVDRRHAAQGRRHHQVEKARVTVVRRGGDGQRRDRRGDGAAEGQSAKARARWASSSRKTTLYRDLNAFVESANEVTASINHEQGHARQAGQRPQGLQPPAGVAGQPGGNDPADQRR